MMKLQVVEILRISAILKANKNCNPHFENARTMTKGRGILCLLKKFAPNNSLTNKCHKLLQWSTKTIFKSSLNCHVS